MVHTQFRDFTIDIYDKRKEMSPAKPCVFSLTERSGAKSYPKTQTQNPTFNEKRARLLKCHVNKGNAFRTKTVIKIIQVAKEIKNACCKMGSQITLNFPLDVFTPVRLKQSFS